MQHVTRRDRGTISAAVPRKLLEDFRSLCVREERTLSEQLRLLMRQAIQAQAGSNAAESR